MADVRLIADEIHFDGHLVAILTTGVPSSCMDEFESGIRNGTLFDGDACENCDGEREIQHKHDCKHYDPPCGGKTPFDDCYEEACADVLTSIKPFAKGGIVRLADLQRILNQLKEDHHETNAG